MEDVHSVNEDVLLINTGQSKEKLEYDDLPYHQGYTADKRAESHSKNHRKSVFEE
jgi:hypothetical protein